MGFHRLHGAVATVLLAVMSASLPAQASDAPALRMAVFGSVWAETNLPELPWNVVTGKLTFHDTWFTSLELSRTLVRDFDIPTPFGIWRGHDLELAAQVVKHWGYQKHVELTGALMWRSPDWRFSDAMSVNLAVGNGLSVALKKPAYEKGPQGIRGVDSHHLQFYIVSELEFTPSAQPDWHMVLRLHHRSGIYGVISPQKTGSNYLGFGLRKDF